jgi:hypothetical protein
VSIEIIRNETDPKPYKSLPELLMSLWPLVKRQWRKNPGFVAATAAGSLGLLLTLAIVIQGGIELLDGPSADSEIGDDLAVADLGEPEDSMNGSLARLFDESTADERPIDRLRDNQEPDDDWDSRRPVRAVAAAERFSRSLSDEERDFARRSRSRILDRSEDDSEKEADDVETDELDRLMAAEARTIPRTVPARRRNPLEEDDPTEDAEDESTSDSRTPPGREVDVNPFDDEEEKPSRKIIESVDIADVDEPDEKTVADSKMPSKNKSAAPQAAISPDIEVEEPADDGFKNEVETSDPATPTVTATETPPSGWHSQPSKPLPHAPDTMARHSRAVETTIYAPPPEKPEEKVAEKAEKKSDPPPGGKTSPAPRQPENSWLALQIVGPRSVAAGEACSFEIHVRNAGSATARHLTLSVELPDALVHEVAQSIEQHIDALPPGQTYRALVKVRAQSEGKAPLNAEVAVGDRVASRLSTAVVISAADK